MARSKKITKYIFLFFIALCCTVNVYSQQDWGYLNFEIPSGNSHGAIYPINENIVHIAADYGYFYKTEDGGSNWVAYDSGVSEYFLDMVFQDSNTGFAVGTHGAILKTVDGGQNWSQQVSGTSEDLISIAIAASNNIWVVGNEGVVLHSTDGGLTWILNTAITSEKLNSIQFKDENVGYFAGNNGAFFHTSTGGAIWNPLSIGTSEDLFSISITENYTQVLAGFAEDGGSYYYMSNSIFKTIDNIQWTNYILEDILEGAADLYFQNDNLGFVMSSAALLCDCCYVKINKSFDVGDTWIESYFEETNADNCNANPGYADLKFADEDIGYALLGNKILTTNPIVFGVLDYTRPQITLYPNPVEGGHFNIEISNTKSDTISIEIFDINGKMIYSEKILKSKTKVSIPQAKAGLYFVQLTRNGDVIETQKLILIQ